MTEEDGRELTITTLKMVLERDIKALEKLIDKDAVWREKIEAIIRANYDAHFKILNHAAEAVTQRNVDFVRESVYSAEIQNLRSDVDRIRLDNASRDGSARTFAAIISIASSMIASLIVGLAVHFLTIGNTPSVQPAVQYVPVPNAISAPVTVPR